VEDPVIRVALPENGFAYHQGWAEELYLPVCFGT